MLARKRKIIGYALVATWIATIVWHLSKPLPEGVDVSNASIAIPQDRIQFLYDLTAQDAWGRRIVEQKIFDSVFAIVDGAREFIVLDFFLFSDDGAEGDTNFRPLSRELTDRLVAKKQALPGIKILFITDPINDVYGGRPSPYLAELKRAGVDVVRTDLERLRDSNAAYSAAWRIGAQWFGNSPSGGWLPDPFRDRTKVTLRSWLALANFKANHRKVIVADSGKDWVGLVTSANPHDASSLHSNVALRFSGELATQVLADELKIAHWSGWSGALNPRPAMSDSTASLQVEAAYVTDGAIRARLIEAIHAATRGDSIDIAVFYISDRAIVAALENAATQGVKVRLILDPNKDAFGHEKDGVPNRPLANELVNAQGSIEVRWYRTRGEQFHTKMVLVRQGKKLFASLGSANLTRRNIGSYNLEANVNVTMPADSPMARELSSYFERLWNNDEQRHIEYTAPFGAFKDDSPFTYWRYRFMETTGLSTF